MYKLFAFYISLGPTTTHSDEELDVINTSPKTTIQPHPILQYSGSPKLCKSSNPDNNSSNNTHS